MFSISVQGPLIAISRLLMAFLRCEINCIITCLVASAVAVVGSWSWSWLLLYLILIAVAVVGGGLWLSSVEVSAVTDPIFIIN